MNDLSGSLFFPTEIDRVDSVERVSPRAGASQDIEIKRLLPELDFPHSMRNVNTLSSDKSMRGNGTELVADDASVELDSTEDSSEIEMDIC
ncbi:hypothetical protein TNCV_4303131 [Trichonephila clavipes]|nr:hypothetical protein TNCV_4303131 [Trichonephila clavipes]